MSLFKRKPWTGKTELLFSDKALTALILPLFLEQLLSVGDGVAVFEAYIRENCTVPYTFAPAHVNKQRAGAVAALGEIYYTEGKTETAEEHKPDYLRLSQAERERLEGEQKK